MKYKLINRKTGEETLCDKVTIDGFDYYVSENPNINDVIVYNNTIGKLVFTQDDLGQGYDIEIGEGVSYPILEPLNVVKKVIATNNPNIDVPKMVDEVEMLGEDETNIRILQHKTPSQIARQYFDGFIKGYNISQETHPFSEEDMIEFAEWCQLSQWNFNGNTKTWWSINYTALFPTTKELLQLWKDQRIKTIYYE